MAKHRIVYRFFNMQDVVAFAIETLKGFSPVGSAHDEHPGLYRDSHLVFIDGHVVKDARDWRPGQQVNISNPVPYSLKIEVGHMHVNVPPHVYERAQPVISAKFGSSVSVIFVYMPVRFSGVAPTGGGENKKARRDWLIHQPALQITAKG